MSQKKCVEKIRREVKCGDETSFKYLSLSSPFNEPWYLLKSPNSLKFWYATVSRNGPQLLPWYTIKDQSNPIGP
jgi:hypothetical protein